MPSSRYGDEKEFTPMQKMRKQSHLTNESDFSIRKSSPSSYYNYFKINSEMRKNLDPTKVQNHDGTLIIPPNTLSGNFVLVQNYFHSFVFT